MSLKKFMLSLFMTVVTMAPMSMCCIPLTVSADIIICDDSSINCTSDLSISGVTAKCDSTAMGYGGKTTKIVINQILQKKTSTGKWSNYGSTNKTVDASRCTLSKTYDCLPKGTYRLSTTATIYSGKTREVVTRYSSTRTVK